MHKTEMKPQTYHQSSDVQFFIAKDFFSLLEFHGEEKILDVGCGDAKTTIALAKLTRNTVYGIDKSSEMVGFSLEQVKKNNINNVFIQEGDAENFNLGKFDLITSFFCGHLIQNCEGMIGSMKRSLSNDGKVILLFPAENNHYFSETMNLVFKKEPWLRYSIKNRAKIETHLRINAYREAIEKNHFKTELFVEEDTIYRFSDKKVFKKWLASILLVLESIPKDLHDDFLSTTVDCYQDYLCSTLNITEDNIFIFRLVKIILA